MARIILVRHGRPDIDTSVPVTGAALAEWSDRYDAALLEPGSEPPEELREAMGPAPLVAASDLPRARESARRAAPHVVPLCDPVYREAPLPTMGGLPFVMQARRWAVWARVAWYLGISRGCESLRDTRLRARAAARALVGHSRRHDVVVLFGHGLFNRFIARALIRRGWAGPREPAHSYWGFSVYDGQ